MLEDLRQQIQEISVEDSQSLLHKPDVAFVDVREPFEWEMGVIPGARLIPLNDFVSQAAELNKELPDHVVVYCAHGNRSVYGAAVLQQLGKAHVYSLAGGTAEWAVKNCELVPPPASHD